VNSGGGEQTILEHDRHHVVVGRLGVGAMAVVDA